MMRNLRQGMCQENGHKKWDGIEMPSHCCCSCRACDPLEKLVLQRVSVAPNWNERMMIPFWAQEELYR